MDSQILKPRATISDLLNLPPEGWEAVGRMTPEELDVYLKGVEELEPKIPADAQWRGKEEKPVKEKKEKPVGQETEDDDNPIKQSKSRKKKSTAEKIKELDEEMEELFKDL